MKSHRLFGLVLIFCALFFSSGSCHAQKYSPEFQALLNQIQQSYLAPKGDNLSSMWNQHPSTLAALVGHALRQQVFHVQQNPSLNNRFTSLQQEARAYITEVARTTTYRGRNEDGSLVASPDNLWFIANKFFQGQEDALILQHYGVRTGTMPSVLAASSRSQPPGRSVAAPPFKEKETNQINLLGNAAPRLEKGPPKEETPPPPRQVTLNPDGIQGIWYSENSAQLKVWKEGDTYLGMLTNQQGTTYENWPGNEICLRLKYVGRDDGQKAPNVKGRLVFKGKHKRHVGNPTGNNYEWQDKTSFYQVTSDGVETFGAYRYSISETYFKRNPR
jgi:hypothetical protein